MRVPSPNPNLGVFRNFWNNMKAIITEPVFDELMWGMLTEQTRPAREDAYRNQDESVADFVARRTSSTVADNVASAIYHGIYAGDIYKLSAQTLMGPYRDLEKNEKRVMSSYYEYQRDGKRFIITDHLLAMHAVEHERARDHWRSLARLVQGSSVLTLKNGLGELVRELAARLKAIPEKVEVLTDTGISSISKNPETSDLTVGRLRQGQECIETI